MKPSVTASEETGPAEVRSVRGVPDGAAYAELIPLGLVALTCKGWARE